MLSTVRRAVPQQWKSALRASRAIHTSSSIHVEASSEGKDYGIDRENPIYLRDHFEEFRNEGYDNLAPEGVTHWADLPKEYQYYACKVDPKDVEEPGWMWQLVTDYRTGLPLAGIGAWFLYVNDVVHIDEELMLWGLSFLSFGVLARLVGPMLDSGLKADIEEIKTRLFTSETRAHDALDNLIDTYEKLDHATAYLPHVNKLEVAIGQEEANARLRQVKTEQVRKMENMLEHMVSMMKTLQADRIEECRKEAIQTVEAQIAKDSKLQQRSIDDALNALKTQTLSGGIVEELVTKELNRISTSADSASISDAVVAQQELMFGRKFGLTDTEVTDAMLQRAESDAGAMALLKAKAGSQPEVGSEVQEVSAFEYLKPE